MQGWLADKKGLHQQSFFSPCALKHGCCDFAHHDVLLIPGVAAEPKLHHSALDAQSSQHWLLVLCGVGFPDPLLLLMGNHKGCPYAPRRQPQNPNFIIPRLTRNLANTGCSYFAGLGFLTPYSSSWATTRVAPTLLEDSRRTQTSSFRAVAESMPSSQHINQRIQRPPRTTSQPSLLIAPLSRVIQRDPEHIALNRTRAAAKEHIQGILFHLSHIRIEGIEK